MNKGSDAELRMQSNFEHLRGELADKDCTGWTCPYCETSAYKYFGFECDECGFDCSDMVRALTKVEDTE